VLVSAIAWCALFAVLAAVAVAFAIAHVAGLNRDPGPLPALSIVLAGMCFAAALFHGLRVRPALRFVREPPRRELIVRHLAAIE
jgi:hypothetical protein